MKEIYDIDMENNQRSKLLSDIPPVDVVITMWCNVTCPFLPCKMREDWGLDDPAGKSDEEFKKVIYALELKIRLESYSVFAGGLAMKDDYGGFGKGTEGFAHFMLAVEEVEKQHPTGGGKPPDGCRTGCGLIVISVIVIIVLIVLFGGK